MATGNAIQSTVSGGGGGSGSVTSVTAADTSIVVTGTPTVAPTLATNTLDVIAANHPPAANWSNNSKKITSLANGTLATDAAALGQVVQSVTAADTSIVVAGTSTAPTLATGTLDVIATNHPPAANWSNNSKKITSLANGTAASDAAAFGQTPAGGSTVTITQGGTGQTTDPLPPFMASDLSWLAWTYDLAVVNGGTALGSGVVNLIRVNLRVQFSITNVIIVISGAGSGLTAGQSFAGLYNSSGTQIGTSTDQSGSWNSSGLKTVALSGGPFNAGPGFVWVVLSSVGTTPPSVVRTGNVSAAAANGSLAAASARYATNGTATTSLPASITPSSNVLTAPAYFAAVS